MYKYKCINIKSVSSLKRVFVDLTNLSSALIQYELSRSANQKHHPVPTIVFFKSTRVFL